MHLIQFDTVDTKPTLRQFFRKLEVLFLFAEKHVKMKLTVDFSKTNNQLRVYVTRSVRVQPYDFLNPFQNKGRKSNNAVAVNLLGANSNAQSTTAVTSERNTIHRTTLPGNRMVTAMRNLYKTQCVQRQRHALAPNLIVIRSTPASHPPSKQWKQNLAQNMYAILSTSPSKYHK